MVVCTQVTVGIEVVQGGASRAREKQFCVRHGHDTRVTYPEGLQKDQGNREGANSEAFRKVTEIPHEEK